MESPDLPMRFPCWVKAVYSWGGESKRDLGFIEGDLIECLNAGDGSWWVGRLYRDKRMVGSFPSNFVKVLDESYHPVARIFKTLPAPKSIVSSPLQPSPSSTTNIVPKKSVGMFRKPFTAYGAADTPSSTAPPSPAGSIKKSFSPKPYSSMKTAQASTPKANTPARAPSPSIPAPVPRVASPMPHTNLQRSSRAPSPLVQRPFSQYDNERNDYSSPIFDHPRAPSPLVHQRPASRISSPMPYNDDSTFEQSRAPSPLPHDRPLSRTAIPMPQYYYQSSFDQSRGPSPHPTRPVSRAASPAPYQTDYDHHQFRAPSPAYPGYNDRTQSRAPSPLYQKPISRTVSPAPYEYEQEEEVASPPPPPPPTHRIAYAPSHAPSSALCYGDYEQDYEDSINRRPSPVPSHRERGRTPSPFRNAMDDVMNSLDEMDIAVRSPSPTPTPDAFLPDRFGNSFAQSGQSQSQQSNYHEARQLAHEDNTERGQSYSSPVKREATPKLANYLRRMDSRLKERQELQSSRYSRPNQTTSPPLERYDSGTTLNAESLNNSPHTDSAYASDPRRNSSDFSSKSVGPKDLEHELRSRKSAYELGRPRVTRSFTAKSAVTDFSNVSGMTDHSLMSGYSAGGFSATSAGSLARRGWGRTDSTRERPKSSLGSPRTGTSMSSISYHSSHNSTSDSVQGDSNGVLGGLQRPIVKKRSFLRRVIDSAKTSAATARSTISAESGESSPSPQKRLPNGVTAISGGTNSAAKSMGLESGVDWLQMRRDVNRCNSLSRAERNERAERCEMMDVNVISPTNVLLQTVEGDESQDGYAVTDPTDFTICNFALVDKNARLINSIPTVVSSASLAQSYICRPYRGDVQRLRAIFTWVSERIYWEEDFEGHIDTQRVIQTKRGCSEEIALLVHEMCSAIGVESEVVRGHLKEPDEILSRHNLSEIARPNHWWNAVIVDGEWRIMDCSLAGPTNPRRKTYSEVGNQIADVWWFLARPMQICYTHVPEHLEQQHIVPAIPQHVLMALPFAGSPYFKYGLQMWDFDTSLLHLEGLETAHIHFTVPEDIECVAEVEARSFAQNADGDFFESGKSAKKRAIAQAEFLQFAGDTGDGAPFKRYTVKALLPASANSSNQAILKIYAGRRGLMHSINNIPHSLALSIPLSHQGVNPEYEFFTRHPTPHALRHELYVSNPLCKRLAINNTFVFGVRQHPSSSNTAKQTLTSQLRPASALSIGRPTSALSMISGSASAYSDPSTTSSGSSHQSSANNRHTEKAAKLAIQTPSGKILRMTRKLDQGGKSVADQGGVERVGSAWETIIKVGEKGTWRGLVLADRSARWCVFGEWECV